MDASLLGVCYQVIEKVFRLFKNIQMQGTRNPED